MGRLTSAFLSSSSLSCSLMSICCEAPSPSSPTLSKYLFPSLHVCIPYIFTSTVSASSLAVYPAFLHASNLLSHTFLSAIFPAYPPLFLPFISLFLSFIIPSPSLCFTNTPLHKFLLLLSEVIHIFPIRDTNNDRESRRDNETQE